MAMTRRYVNLTQLDLKQQHSTASLLNKLLTRVAVLAYCSSDIPGSQSNCNPDRPQRQSDNTSSHCFRDTIAQSRTNLQTPTLKTFRLNVTRDNLYDAGIICIR